MAAWMCESLKKLDLSHNSLKALPDTFGNLHLLTYMHVSHNSLQELPPSCSLGCINLVSFSKSAVLWVSFFAAVCIWYMSEREHVCVRVCVCMCVCYLSLSKVHPFHRFI